MNWRHLLYGRSPARTLVRVGVVALVLVGATRVAVLPLRAHGISMLPTYHEGQMLVVNRLGYLVREPRRGDIVGIRLAGGRAALVKRIVALPGERVRIASGVVYVDDRGLDEPYVRQRRPWQVPEVTLGPDEFFVIGDNRGMPSDFHDFGAAARDRIIGPLLF